MGAVSVASVVASIISAFGSGMEVFHRLGVGTKKSRCRARPPQPWEEAEWDSEWVQESLQSRPLQIKHEYDLSVGRFGRHFEVGDSTAHSSLAQTLLVLNTGLIKLINHALSDNQSQGTVMSSNKALFSLSEAAASDTMAALEQLRTRLSLTAPRPLGRIPRGEKEEESQDRIGRHCHRGHHKTQTHQESSLSLSLTEERPQQHSGSRASTPLLVRGGWVRSKNGGTSSVVVPSAAAAVRKAKRARKTDQDQDSTTSSQSKSSSGSTATTRTRTRTRTLVSTQTEPGRHAGNPTDSETSASVSPDRVRRHRQESPKHDALAVLDHARDSKPQRQPSMLIVPSDFFDVVQVPPEQSYGRRRLDPPPPRPPKIPLDSKPPPPPPPPPRRAFIDGGRRAPRPTSTMTFMTASTKIGEIPESRRHGQWQGQILPNSVEGLADTNKTWGPAYTVPPPLEPLGNNGAKTTKKSCFKFWRRDGKG
ncbi:hypothetical protein ABEF95_017236 [Exophiala dermatitidis]